MTTHKFDKEENDLLGSYERGEWKSIPTLKDELQNYRAYAANTIAQNKLIGINLSPDDFQKIQDKAQEKGLPYQTFIADIVHQFVAGRLVEQS
jgi:predicted DNA binding CopG/RHH family protein